MMKQSKKEKWRGDMRGVEKWEKKKDKSEKNSEKESRTTTGKDGESKRTNIVQEFRWIVVFFYDPIGERGLHFYFSWKKRKSFTLLTSTR